METIDGKKVYDLLHTHGLPLDITLHKLSARDIVVRWDEYFKAALDDNMKIDNELRRVSEAIQEVFGKEYLEEWQTRAKYMILKMLKEIK